MNGGQKMEPFEYPMYIGRGASDDHFVSTDEYIFVIPARESNAYVRVFHKAYNRWLPPFPIRQPICTSNALTRCFALPSDQSAFVALSFFKGGARQVLTHYALSPSGAELNIRREVQLDFAKRAVHAMPCAERRCVYVIADDGSIHELAMDASGSAEIGKFERRVDYAMLHESTIYAVHTLAMCTVTRLSKCAFDVTRRRQLLPQHGALIDRFDETIDGRMMQSYRNQLVIWKHPSTIIIIGMTARNATLAATRLNVQQFDRRQLLISSGRRILRERFLLKLLENGEMLLLSSFFSYENRECWTMRHRTARFLRPPTMSDIALCTRACPRRQNEYSRNAHRVIL